MSELINYRDGRYLYKGRHSASQVEGVEVLFEQFLVEEKFNAVLEIGTLSGGLTYVVNDVRVDKQLDFLFTTVDYSIKDYLVDEFKDLNINYLYYDERTPEFKTFATDYIRSNGKVCILCDGGNKVEEFNTLAPYLKPGDFIMCHDYVVDRQEFEKNYRDKIWNFHEVKLVDIKKTVEEQDLAKYTDINFESKVWACYKKQ